MMMNFKFLCLSCFLFVAVCEAQYRRNYIGNGVGENTPSNITYLGCYNDQKDARDVYEKDYTRVTKLNNSYAIVEICVRLCAMANFKFAAVQSYDECYCGNSYGRYNRTNEVNCFFKCSGYSCGGYDANSIYSTAISASQLVVNQNANNMPNNIQVTKNVYYKPRTYNPCEVNPCKNSGICISILDGKGKFKSFICQCRNPEHIGPLCEQTNYCYSSPCLHGGSCISVVDGYQCICHSAWFGVNCAYPSAPVTKAIIAEKPAMCNTYENSMCKNGATCLKTSYTSIKCLCAQNYTGTYCEVFDICSMKPCKHDGQCSFNAPSNFVCNCSNKYYGTFCELENPCFANGVNPCLNGGICRNQIIADTKSELTPKTNQSYICLCYGNFMGKNCDLCKTGYEGEKCDRVVNYCQPNPCKHGYCQWQLGSYQCNCYEGFQGKHCDMQSCRFKPCLNGGVCAAQYNNDTATYDYICNCPPQYLGENCEITTMNPCDANPCQPTENCLVTDDSYKCEAKIQTIEMINLCDVRPNICKEDAVCTFNHEDNGYYCRCLHNENTNEASACNYALSYKDFFENSTVLMTTTAVGETLDHTEVLESKGTLKLFNGNFNSENLYWIVPLSLVVILIFMFLGIATVFGFKARNHGRSQFGKKELSTKSRSRHHFDDTSSSPSENQFKSISTITVPNIKCSNSVNSNNESMQKYLDSYGRVV